LDIILTKVRIVPNHFEKFCTILKTDPHFKPFLDSMIVCFTVYSSETEITEFINIISLVIHLNDLLSSDEKAALDFNAFSNVNRTEKNLKDYLTMILKQKDPKFVKMFMKHLASDTSNSKLYQLLQGRIDSFNGKVCNPSVSVSVAIREYREHLKQFYLQGSKPVADDNFEGAKIGQYINLSLITPEQYGGKESDYFKAITDPYSLLFKRDDHSSETVPLKSLSDIFDKSESKRQVILIQGSPGSGKTTLANEICRQWARRTLIQNFALVILIKLRDHRIANLVTIDEFINCTTGNADFACETIQDIYSCHGVNTLLLLEGWDERCDDQQHNSFLASIVSGKLLKDASVLITSRPSSIGTIQKSLVTRNIAILGFSEDQIKQYLQQCLRSCDSYNKFLNELDSHGALKSLACIPVNLSILVHVFKKYGGKLPSSWTELYQKYFLLKLSHYNSKIEGTDETFEKLESLLPYIKEPLIELSKVALYELLDDKFSFTERKILQYYGHDISMDYDGMGLLQVENLLLYKSCHRTFSFLHKTVQEFAAAWYLTTCDEQEKMIIDMFENRRCNYEVVMVFYAGLTGLKGTINIETILSPLAKIEIKHNLIVNISRLFFNIFRKSITVTDNILATYLAKVYYDSYAASISNAITCETLLFLVICCSEAQNPAACRALCNSNLFYSGACYVKIPESALTSQVLSSLSYCITHSGKRWTVGCPALNADDIACLRKSFNGSEISGELTGLFTQVGKKQIDCFMPLLQSQCCIHVLDLCNSKEFDDYCVTLLASVLSSNKYLTHIYLDNCNVSSNGLLTIAKMLQTNNVLIWINMLWNAFSCDDIKIALQQMEKNTSLLCLGLDQSLIDSDLKALLSKFNKNRKYSLSLHSLEAIMYGSSIFTWLKEKMDGLIAE